MPETTRRHLLKMAGALSVGALFNGPLALKTLAATQDPMKQHDYSGWENFHRMQWSWDKKTRGAHLINCTGSCPHFVYAKDGVVLREEQTKDVPTLKGIPEYNPRGCQKGECATDYQYGPHRLKYPLIRTGERGEGKWRRATWDEALELIATRIVDTIQNHAPDCISVYSPVPAVAPVSFAAGHRFAHLIGGHTHTFFDWYGDHPTGQTQTCGVQGDTCETADWFNARYILLWGANPTSTRIPDAHFLSEAQYNGTKIVSISPDYNQSTIKADLWVHPKPGTDAALALGMVHVIIRDGLFDPHHLKEQTDFPFLVRADTKRFLREADMVDEGSDAKFYSWDMKTKQPVLMKGSWADQPEDKPQVQPAYLGRNTLTFPKGYLDLGALDPALEGTFKVKLKDGSMVDVRPVFAGYKERILKEYSPEKVAAITGVNPKTIVQIAKDYATAKPAMIISGGGTNHWYYSDVLLRCFHVLSALTNGEGVNGGGVNHYIGQWKPVAVPGVLALSFPQTPAKQRFCQTTIWSAVHGEAYDGMESEKIDTAKHLRKSLATRQMPMYPRDGLDPKVFIVYRGNFLNQAKGQKYVLRNLWPKLDLIVDINVRMDSTALYSDVVLPSAHWYEKTDLSMTEEHTFVHMTEPAIPPLWDSKTDWEIFALLARKVQEVAVAKGFTKYYDEQFKWARDLSTLYAQQTADGKLVTDVQAAQFILDSAPQTKGITLDMIREKGPQRFKANWTSAMEEGVPYTPFKFFVADKKPWPTLTGRQQFYIDHETFFEMGVELPVYKAPIDADKYPLRFNTPHSRYAIHSTWKDNVLMLRLQRGGPVVEMPPSEAALRGLKDNDWAEVWNDHGRIVCRVKIRAGEPAGRVTMAHTPELYMDLIEGSTQSVCPIRITPTHLVGNYGHLLFRPNYYGPGGTQRDVRVEIRRYTGAVPV
ncbi:molybdopterin-dependent oxidoreductase [Azospirillum sp. TSO22-1]|uniref:molybdopterin-dependent oxidoreductase n=1 Tax=Azospirillum sp. TSO22-1 TaxID=716789 RepID=UPI000D61F8CE|nr:molybdopterin-dependent oxidoreductase [Azospirillum sp. TSO22-1]PWC40410.1 molybdopterin oxidoreductase [Azospirillum sp. TSO22-1]